MLLRSAVTRLGFNFASVLHRQGVHSPEHYHCSDDPLATSTQQCSSKHPCGCCPGCSPPLPRLLFTAACKRLDLQSFDILHETRIDSRRSGADCRCASSRRAFARGWPSKHLMSFEKDPWSHAGLVLRAGAHPAVRLARGWSFQKVDVNMQKQHCLTQLWC